MDHLLANSEKPIPEADEDDEEAIQSLESGEQAKVSYIHLRHSWVDQELTSSRSNVLNVGKSFDHQLLLHSMPRNRVIKSSKSRPRR